MSVVVLRIFKHYFQVKTQGLLTGPVPLFVPLNSYMQFRYFRLLMVSSNSSLTFEMILQHCLFQERLPSLISLPLCCENLLFIFIDLPRFMLWFCKTCFILNCLLNWLVNPQSVITAKVSLSGWRVGTVPHSLPLRVMALGIFAILLCCASWCAKSVWRKSWMVWGPEW